MMNEYGLSISAWAKRDTVKHQNDDSLIYVYLLWDPNGGYWTKDTPENRDKIDDSDHWYWAKTIDEARAAHWSATH